MFATTTFILNGKLLQFLSTLCSAFYVALLATLLSARLVAFCDSVLCTGLFYQQSGSLLYGRPDGARTRITHLERVASYSALEDRPIVWFPELDLNQRLIGYQPITLTTELPGTWRPVRDLNS